jgi:hypothetical protein
MTDTHATVRPIETVYRGFRFRSRLEARWAVFFDAAGIEWRYEDQGFDVGGRWYLPDFWLPKLKAFVEVKPNEEAVGNARSVLRDLALAHGCHGLLTVGTPNQFEMFDITKNVAATASTYERKAWLNDCPFCTNVVIDDDVCACAGDVFVIKHHNRCTNARVRHAQHEAMRARFEHGETGTPSQFHIGVFAKIARVYAAGAVLEETPSTIGASDNVAREGVLTSWRDEIFGTNSNNTFDSDIQIGRFQYAGPTIQAFHGNGYQNLGSDCLAEVKSADAFFAWIDRDDTVGTLVEIGAAYAYRKPIFIAFTNETLDARFYFARQLADVAIISPSVKTAWGLFMKWCDARDAIFDHDMRRSWRRRWVA